MQFCLHFSWKCSCVCISCKSSAILPSGKSTLTIRSHFSTLTTSCVIFPVSVSTYSSSKHHRLQRRKHFLTENITYSILYTFTCKFFNFSISRAMNDELFSQEELSIFQGHIQRALDLATESQKKGVSHREKIFLYFSSTGLSWIFLFLLTYR